MSDDLVACLLAAIQEREEFARGALDRRWLCSDNYLNDENDHEVARFNLKADAQHAGLNEPQSVLLLCQAHRKIIEAYQGALFTQECHPEYEDNNGYVQALRDVLRWLAEGYGIEATP